MTKRILKINVMEVPDIIDWVKPGELLLTTAYSIRDNINVLCELIPKLSEKGVVGLGIKIHRYIEDVPENIIEIAEALNFPLIQIPLSVSYADIMSIIQDEIIDEQMTRLLKIEKFDKEVMETIINGGSLKDIAKKLYDNIGNSLAVYERINDNCVIMDNNSDKLDRNFIDKIANESLDMNYNEIYNQTMDLIGEKKIKRITIPIVVEKIEYGRIFIWLDKKELEYLDKILIGSYVHIIALDFVKELSIQNMESNYKLEFFNNLLSNNQNRLKHAIESANTFNYNLEMKHTVVVIYFNEFIEDKNIVSSFKSIINRNSRFYKDKVLYVDKIDRIVILFESDITYDAKLTKEKVTSFCSRILTEALKKNQKAQFKIGIGRSYNEVSNLYKSYEQAIFIIENLNSSITDNIVHYDDLGLYRILCFEGLQGELTKFCNDTITPLLEYDKLNNTEFISTLRIFFECNGNMKKMSKKMFLHYNTIIYRLQKIQDLTGLNINNSEERLDLEVSLKALTLINSNG